MNVRGKLRALAVHFHPDLHAVVARDVAAPRERMPDLVEGLVLRNAARKSVGPHFHTQAAQVLRQFAPAPRVLNILFDEGRLRPLVLAGGAQAHQTDARIGKALLHFRPARFVERNFHAVLVRGAQLHAFKSRLLAILDDRVDVPIMRQVVSDQSQLERWRRGRRIHRDAVRSARENTPTCGPERAQRGRGDYPCPQKSPSSGFVHRLVLVCRALPGSRFLLVAPQSQSAFYSFHVG